MNKYDLILSTETIDKISDYRISLKTTLEAAGSRFRRVLASQELTDVPDVENFIRLLLQTKRPQIFAESDIAGDGSDWNSTELSILGDISVAVSVCVYDNGAHSNPVVHKEPFKGYLLFVPGALLRSSGSVPCDLAEVAKQGDLDDSLYYKLYQRRLLPVLLRANSICKEHGKKGFITVPGLGCGQFAGRFIGWLGQKLNITIKRLLDENHHRLDSISAVYYDPYEECTNERETFGNVTYFVRPLTQGNDSRSQLCLPGELQDASDDFSECLLFSIVAWDHVSWPGNDFYIGARSTDDGVKAAATDTMYKMTDVQGSYCYHSNRYVPPPSYQNWDEVVRTNKILFGQTAEMFIF